MQEDLSGQIISEGLISDLMEQWPPYQISMLYSCLHKGV